MRKSLGIVLAVLLVAAMSVPAMGATLKVSGKYVGEVVYDGGLVYSKNPYAFDGNSVRNEYKVVDLLRMSTLYLNIDFAEGEVMSAHIPLRLYKADVLTVEQNPDDKYLFVFKGAPLVLSLTDATSGDYAFASFGDPLGLVKSIGTGARATFKAAGQPFGLGFTSYFIAMDPKATTYPRYALGRVTYGLASGHTLGAIYAAKEGTDKSVLVNVEADVTGPLPVSEGAKFTAALALERTQEAGVWSNPVNAFEVNVSGIAAGNFTLSGNVRAVDPEFEAVAPYESDAVTFKGKRQLQGEAVTNVNIGGQAVKLTLGDDYRVAYDGSLNDAAYNKIYGKGEFSPSEPVKVTVGGFYQDFLIKTGPVADDNRKNIYGNVEYTPAENITVTGGAQWMSANLGTAEGSGFKLDGSAEVKPAAGVLVKGSAAYESGRYDFIDGDTVTGSHTRLDAEAYAEAKQTFVPAGIKQVDTTLAGLARGVWLSSPDAQTTYVGYADANIILNDLFSNKIAVMSGKSTEVADHYFTTVYNKFTYTVSSNSTFELGYTYKNNKGTLDAAYTVKLGDSTIKLSYGASGLSDPCDNDFDDGRPWAWLCTASIEPNPDFYKLTITIPF
ncbi:MAG: hypothetical protein H5T95_00295 [Firmicutes bacterium]|nr:hypothetical protein [Bacillota bacterium]